MKFINADTVFNAISYPELMDGLLQLHREGRCEAGDMLIGNQAENAENFILIRAAFQDEKAIGVKMASVFPANHDIPSIQAVFVLFDGKTGTPSGLVDGLSLTWRKTASDSGLGSKLLSRPDSQSLLMVGAGSMAPHLIKAHLAARPKLEKLSIWNRTTARAADVANDLQLEGINIQVTEDLQDAIGSADIICSATMSVEPIIKGEWLKAGTHLDLVGAYRLDMREADDLCLERSKIYVDSRKTTIGEIGEIDIPLKNGIISENDILGDFYDLCQDNFRLDRKTSDITLFKNGGGGHLDLMTARLIYQASFEAKQQN